MFASMANSKGRKCITSSFIMFDSFAADQAFVIINTNAESSWFFSAKLSIFLQAASKVGELMISWNFNSAAFSASMFSVAASYACTAARQEFPSFAKAYQLKYKGKEYQFIRANTMSYSYICIKKEWRCRNLITKRRSKHTFEGEELIINEQTTC